MDPNIFVREFSGELENQNAALFAGAGLSMGSGYVNWKELLRPIADELGLCVDKEENLLAVAQYHCNENAGNRHRLNQLLITQFGHEAAPTENHRILARLPISTYWTTNYDKLIERALEASDKISDVKHTVEQLTVTKPRRDAIVYKMHGDIDHPAQAVLTKDDYESYHVKMEPFIRALSGDLVSKTFLFVGFSFTDPNLDYILSRVRTSYSCNQRAHYCLMKRVTREAGEAEGTFVYRSGKQDHFIKDLKRFNIRTVLLETYEEITALLKKLESRFRQRTIFISGSAHDYGSWERAQAEMFVHKLSKSLVEKSYRVVSGFGVGVGSAVINGALETIYFDKRRHSKDQLLLHPFPQIQTGKLDLAATWNLYRQEMISYAGISVFLFGNKLVDGHLALADGVRKEFAIARELGLRLLPIGATGFVAEELWSAMCKSLTAFYPSSDDAFQKAFLRLGDKSLPPETLLSSVLNVITTVSHL
jgi:hypothetical protein